MELQLQGRTYTPTRLKLRKWLEFEQHQNKIHEASAKGDVEAYCESLCTLIADALCISIEEVIPAPWYEVTLLYGQITSLNQIKEIPMVRPHPHKKEPDAPWEYEGRDWFWWVHTLAKNYGWVRKEVEDLDIDEALALFQEIAVEEQTRKEWEWGMSEIAYPYNASTKKSTFKPLDRPAWMQEKPAVFLPATKVKFHKSMIPLGRVIGEDGSERIIH